VHDGREPETVKDLRNLGVEPGLAAGDAPPIAAVAAPFGNGQSYRLQRRKIGK